MQKMNQLKREILNRGLNILIVISTFFLHCFRRLLPDFSSSSISETGISLWGRHEVLRHTIIGETNAASQGLFRIRSGKTFVCFWRDSPKRARAFSFTRFLDPRQRRTTACRTHLDEWSAPRRDLYLTTHNTHNRQTSVTPVGLEPTISAGERPQTYALDRAATGTGKTFLEFVKKAKLHDTCTFSLFSALYIVNVLVGTLKRNWTLVVRGFPIDNFRFIPHQDKLLRKLY